MKTAFETVASTSVATSDMNAVFTEIVKISNRTAQGVLEIGALIFNFDEERVLKTPDVEHNELETKLIDEKIMAASTISCYRTIGGCAVLRDLVNVLPPFFNHIYVLAAQEKKKPGFIRMKVESGELNRATTLVTIRSWLAPAKQESTQETAFEKVERNGRLMLRVYVDEDGMNKVIQQLSELESSTDTVEVDYSEVHALDIRAREQEVKSARRSAYTVIKQFKADKLAELKTRFKASVAKANFDKSFAEVAEFLEFNDLTSIVTGRTGDDALNTALQFIGAGVCMNDFYKDALSA